MTRKQFFKLVDDLSLESGDKIQVTYSARGQRQVDGIFDRWKLEHPQRIHLDTDEKHLSLSFMNLINVSR